MPAETIHAINLNTVVYVVYVPKPSNAQNLNMHSTVPNARGRGQGDVLIIPGWGEGGGGGEIKDLVGQRQRNALQKVK